jgi:oligoendopeptidase F
MNRTFRPARHALGAAALALFMATAHAAPASPAPSAATPRPAADAQRWDLRDLYPTPAAWDAAYEDTRARVDQLDGLKATLGNDAASLYKVLATYSDVRRSADRLGVYANLKADEDLRDAPSQERRQRSQTLYTLMAEKTAWLAGAIQALGAERVRAFIAADAGLKTRFDTFLDDTLRNAPHTLGAEGESLLASSSALLAQPNNVFSQLADAELPRATVKLSNGKIVTLTSDVYESLRVSPLRADRERVFKAYFGSWKKFEGSFGANLAAQVQGDVFAARARRHAGSLEGALFSDNMPPAVYKMLVAQANEGLPTLHRYLRLRKQALGIQGDLAYHDNYPPLQPRKQGETFDIERSKAITLAALAPMGDEYLGLLKQGMSGQWMDSHPRPAKRSGAYMAGSAYDVHPYVLLNHTGDFNSLSTFAHEWGHGVHSLLAKSQQPFEKADYSTFIAESASIANEMLLSDYMVANAKTREDKLFYLAQGLESIRTTFFRQTMFAEFQLAMHQEVEQGKPLSGARLSELYCGLVRRYYGEAQGVMKIDPAYCVEWTWIPHFYFGYYVWQYASSMVGAAEFSAAITQPVGPKDPQQAAAARDRFVNLLKAGSSNYAYPLYVKAGVDLAQPGPYRALMARMNRLMDDYEKLAAAPGR